ncbi:MAG: DUF2142 domain-containing protein [Bacilli bacterium]|nr:DUF2142 domain-containing protein [Bacilli bacterium]
MKKKYNLIIYIIFCLIFMTINILFLFNKMPHYITLEFNKTVRFILLMIMMLFEITFSSLVYILYKKKNAFEKLFLIVALSLGLLLLVLIPVGKVPDEYSHFGRAYDISMGNLMASEKGSDMPIEIATSVISEQEYGNYSEIIKKITTENSGQTSHYVFLNTAVYNFICYIPQTIGIIVGKVFNAPVLLDAYLGRITNFICWITLLYFSIKFIPFAKKYLILISLLPITLQEAVSLSPDALTFASCVFLISYTLYLANTKREFVIKDYVILSVMCIIVSLCKIVYMPVCLILFILPKEKFKSLKDKNIKILSLALIVITLNLSWLKIASGFLIETHPGVNPVLQKNWVLSHPFSYLKVLIMSIYTNYHFYLSSMMGQSLELLSVDVTGFYPKISLFGLIILTILDRFTDIFIKFKDKILFLFIVISIIVLIFTSLYIQWTPVKYPVVDGVQGRYFLPLLCLIPLIFYNSKKRLKTYDFNYLNIYVLVYSIFANLGAFIYIFAVNY